MSPVSQNVRESFLPESHITPFIYFFLLYITYMENITPIAVKQDRNNTRRR